MAYIAPNSTIQLFKDIMLTPDSEDTAYFTNKSVQDTFFTQHIYATFSNTSYTRLKRNTIKLSGSMGNLYNCNYMRFRNDSFENQWFYAFITKIDYVNNETVEIDYEIDYVQTWLFSPDVAYEQCYIERQHDRYDNLFGNFIPEGLEIGELISTRTRTYQLQTANYGFNVGILVSTTPNGTRIAGGMAYGIFTGLGMYGDTPANILSIIQSYTDPTNIVCIFMYPSIMGTVSIDSTQQEPWLLNDNFDTVPDFTHLGSYVPRNNKLYTYPYNFVRIYSAGQERDYHYENWTNSNNVGKFKINATIMPPVTSACVPYTYKGEAMPFDESLTVTNFPQCPWSDDTFKAWLAQNKASYVASLISGTQNAMIGAALTATTGFGSMGAGGLHQVYNTVATRIDKSHAPPTVHGASISDTMFAGRSEYDFTSKQMCVKPEIAAQIDGFFDMYGYRQNKVAYPDLKARQNWTYIKTIGCGIHGDLPAEDNRKICDRFDKGIRFWVNPLRIGDYSMSNTPEGAQP